MIEREDFEMWLANPVTVRVFANHRKLMDEYKSKWIAASWEGGETNPLLLADLRARNEVANDLITVSYEDIDDNATEAETG